MLWFKKKQVHQEELANREAAVTLDVEHHKRQSAQVVAQTKKAVDNLNRELRKNNITIRISVAAGARKR